MTHDLIAKLTESFGSDAARTHLCHFYKSAEQQIPVLKTFLEISRRRKDPTLVIWNHTNKEVAALLREYAKVPFIRIVTGVQAAQLEGHPKKLFAYRIAWLQEVNPHRDRDIRMYSDMSSFFKHPEFKQNLLWWEVHINRLFSDEKMFGLFQYDENRLSPEIIKLVIQTHPNILVQGKMYPNQYYLPSKQQQHHLKVDQIIHDVKEKATTMAQVAHTRETAEIAHHVGQVGMFEWIIADNEVWYSPELRSLYQMPDNHDHDSFAGWMKHVHPEDRSKVTSKINWSIKHIRNVNVEFRIQTPHKVTRWLLFKGHIDYTEKLKPVRVVGVHIDITEKVKSTEARYDVISLAGHEMRMPLTVLKGYGYLMRTCLENNNSKKAAQYLDKMEYQLNRLSRYVDDLLNIYKIDKEIFELQLKEIRLDELILKVVKESQLVDSGKRLMLGKVFPAIVKADSHLIEGVLINLITNALKYSSPKQKVLVTCEKMKDSIRVEVIDKGIGISLKQQKEVFKRFYRVHSDESITGLGIGLYLAAEIIKKHSGTIKVTSKEGKGSTFSFELPLVLR